MALSSADLARLFGGELAGDGPAEAPLAGVATDSREVVEAGAFVALRGPAHDGHAFVGEAAGRGARIAVVERSWSPPTDGRRPPLVLRVGDTAAGLRAACRARLDELGCATLGITGSVGKTTAKEMAALALARLGVARTPGNLNTWTGIPVTVLELEAPVELLVAELAMSAPGEIADLCALVRPECGVLLNVGLAHVGLLGSVGAIADAKAEILEALPADGLACCNADDPEVRRVASRSAAPVLWFGLRRPDAAYRATELRPDGMSGTRFRLHGPGGSAEARLGVPGEHAVLDACAVAAAASRWGVDVAEVAERLADFRAPAHRGSVHRAPCGALVYDDCYNSSPSALRAALSVLGASGAARRVAVLGDMLELGDHAAGAHREAGRDAARAATDLIAVGEHAAEMAAAATGAGLDPARVAIAAGAADAAERAAALCRPGAAILVKASRSVALERVVERLLR